MRKDFSEAIHTHHYEDATLKLNHPFKFTGSVPNQVRMEVLKLSGPKARPFIIQLVMAWAVIATAIFSATYFKSWWVSILAILAVSSRQNILGLLVHEQAHKLGIRGMKGDLFTNIFAAYPLLVLSVENYAKVHLTHHKYYFTEKDPDHLRKSGKDWHVPFAKKNLARLFLQDISGLSTIKFIAGKNAVAKATEFDRDRPTPKFVRIGFLLTLVATLTFTQTWSIFLLYWVLPLLTFTQLIVRWGALTEHVYNTGGSNVEENSPLIIPGFLDRLLIPNLNFSFHVYHHWYPGVSFSQLPRVHQIFLENDLIDKSKVFYGYFDYFKFLISPGEYLLKRENQTSSQFQA